jgi:ABC-2 type transport system ATP-binding protein
MPDSFVIQTHTLSKTYKGTHALKALDLAVPPNSIFGFLGPNSAGKTTTMKLLLGLIRPTSGGGSVFGMDIQHDSVRIRSRVGYLPQDPRFYEHMTARETLDFTARFFFDGPGAEIKKRVQETLELVGLEDKADRRVKTFSGGERQRLGIAQAQVNYPDLLILDEPAASLDPLGRRDVLQVMERLRKYTTIFYSTHILDDVQHVSDTVAILNHGELVAYGPIQTLLYGSSATVYAVSLEGDVENAFTRLKAQPWVTEIQNAPGATGKGAADTTAADTGAAGEAAWLVSVSDDQQAKDCLLRLLLEEPSLVITQFGRKRYELEEVFLNIVEGGGNGR